MAQRPISPLLRYLHRLFENKEIAALTDRQLLQRFAADRSDAAFTVLVRRHGGMVLGVCSRVLHDPADAEDAFQATFLVLARKGSSFGWQDSIGNWLYGVALRVASKMKSQRRRTNEVNAVAKTVFANGSSGEDPSLEAIRRELAEKLDSALRRLPSKYRAPLVLCYLEGKTHQDAARELGLPAGSISRRLARGLELLRERLAQSNLCLSLESLTALLSHGTWRAIVERTLAEATAQAALLFKVGALAATGTVSARIITLAEGMLRTMIFTNLKVIMVGVLTIGILGAGGVLQGRRQVVERSNSEELEPVAMRVVADPTKIPDPLVAFEQPPQSSSVEKERAYQLFRSKMAKPVVLEKGLERMTFGEAKNYFEDRFDITILANAAAFPKDSNPLESEVKFDKMAAISLQEVLEMMMNQIDATYLLHPYYIEITSPEFARPESWVAGDRTHVPRVHADFKDVPLDEALRELAIETGIPVTLDRRGIDPSDKPRVTSLFDGVCLDTAVEMLANMSGLKTVALDRALYVTTEINADNLRAQQEQRHVAHEKFLEKQKKEELEKKKAAELKKKKENPSVWIGPSSK